MCHVMRNGFWFNNLGTMEVVLQKLLNGMVLTLRSLDFIKYYIRAPSLTHKEKSIRYKYPSVNAVNPKNCMKAIAR